MTTTTVVASHSLLLALPAFMPALLLVGVIVVIAVRDRRQGENETRSDELEEVSEPSGVADDANTGSGQSR